MKRFRDGNDPHPRFSLANGRTVLAWRRLVAAISLLVLISASLAHSSQNGIHLPQAITNVLALLAFCLSFLSWKSTSSRTTILKATDLRKLDYRVSLLLGSMSTLVSLVARASLSQVVERP